MKDLVVPENLAKIIAVCLDQMLSRHLNNAPAADEITFAIDVMAQDLFALGYAESHHERIIDAFNFYGQHYDTWPTTNQIIQTLKSRTYVFADKKLLQEKRRKWVPWDKDKDTPAKVMADSMRSETVHKKLTRGQIKTINDEDHKRLLQERSHEGIAYRHMMGAPEPKHDKPTH